jgi:aspartyl-tRNA(Asn)/glutamyl-tRNA(Gln) amidotransferase subunit C
MPNMREDLQHAVKLARIELTAEEEARLGSQLGDILKYVDKLNELDVEGVEPTAHAVPLTNVLREDEPRESISHEAAMRNAPKTANGLFIVPKIVE